MRNFSPSPSHPYPPLPLQYPSAPPLQKLQHSPPLLIQHLTPIPRIQLACRPNTNPSHPDALTPRPAFNPDLLDPLLKPMDLAGGCKPFGEWVLELLGPQIRLLGLMVLGTESPS